MTAAESRAPLGATPIRPPAQTWPGQAEEPDQVLDIVAAPNLGFSPVFGLVFGLITVGLLAVMVWAATPTLAKTGATGAGLLLTGAAGLVTGSVSPVAIVLLLSAAASLWFEVCYLPGVGLYAICGWFALTLAGFTLGGLWVGAHPAIVLSLATLTATGTYLAGLRAWRRLDADPMTPAPLVYDRHTVVLHTDGQYRGRGYAVLAGRLWAIRAHAGGALEPGQRIRVLERMGEVLVVEPDPAPAE